MSLMHVYNEIGKLGSSTGCFLHKPSKRSNQSAENSDKKEKHSGQELTTFKNYVQLAINSITFNI